MRRLARAGAALGVALLVPLAGCGTGSSAVPSSVRASVPQAKVPSTLITPSGATSTPTATAAPTVTKKPAPPPAHGSVRVVRTLTTGLDVPWGMAVLPGHRALLVTTRDDGTVHRVDLRTGRTRTVGHVPSVSRVSEAGESGLLGLALSPGFTRNHRVYLYWSTRTDNRVGWARYTEGRLGRPHVILSGIPVGVHHNGGGLAFGPDKMLYVGTGETEITSLAQDKRSLGGKVLRITPAGRPAPGNPFHNDVWTYGHRNVEGLVFDPAGRLWASEFGDRTADELNLIRKGHDYGWPATQGKTSDPRYTSPVAQWGTEVDSPSGIAYAGGVLWMAALKGERLWRIPMDGTRVEAAPQSFLDATYGRLRSVVALGPHTLVVSTSNRDGRTTPRPGDDRLLVLRVR